MTSPALHRILVCVDRSAYAEICLNQALAIAKCLGGSITLLHVQPVSEERRGSGTTALEWELGREEALTYLEGLQAEAAKTSTVEVTTRVEQGEPAERIVNVARELGAELTVFGEHGKRQTASRGLGSTAEQILAFARESVLVVRDPSKNANGALPSCIFVPLDGSLRAESVLPTALRIAREHHAEIVLAYAVAEPVESAVLFEPADLAVARDLATRLEASGRRYLGGLQERLVHEGATARTAVLRHADVCKALVELSLAEHPELIVLSAHGVTCNPELNSGTVASSLLRQASAPLLVVQDLQGPDLHGAPESLSAPPARASYAPELGAV